ncbi:hypothetical protein F5884DRAFT_762087 [Xylogone sp. PMI_703]|nr:hypothetical protein F5884DRAFT_762087 [Xylogone sp. PMI_703]
MIVAAIYEENAAANHEDPDSWHSTSADAEDEPARLLLMHDVCLSGTVVHDKITKTMNGYAEHVIFHDPKNIESLATNLVLVETKRPDDFTEAVQRLICCMGIVFHAARKRDDNKTNHTVHGVVSNGEEYLFYRIDNQGRFSGSLRQCLRLHKNKIFATMRLLLREAALSPPSTSPMKNPHKRRIVVESFGNPATSVYFGQEGGTDDCDEMDLF